VVHELVDERIGVIRLIGNDRTRVGMFEQWFSASKIVILPRSIKTHGLPNASASAWILVLGPPRDRPMACFRAPALCW
jgi:hypothetical protein